MAVANIGSEAWCRKAYLNYHCYGNTMGLTPADMGEITNAWSDRLSSWQNSVSNDETEYDFDDSEYANYKDNGKEAAKEATGHDGKKGGDIARGTADLAVSAGGAATNLFVSGAAKVASTTACKVGAKTGAQKAISNSLSWSISAPLALATAIMYMVKKPNKEAKEACDALQGEMTAAQETLTATQEEMETYIGEIEELSDEAYSYNEDTNEELEEQKTEYDMYYETMLNIQAKIDAGEPLTESEKELYKSVIGYLQEIGINIEELTETTSEEIQAIFEEMGIYQDGFDEAAQTMGEIEGLTDYAEGFDSATRAMCYVEGAAQTINAASGYFAGTKATLAATASWGFNVWAWACAAMGFSAGVMSTFASKEQFQWAGKIGTEIELRKGTQDLNSETMGVYDENIDYYDGYMQGIEDLELEIPDDIAPPSEGELSTSSGTTAGDDISGASGSGQPDTNNGNNANLGANSASNAGASGSNNNGSTGNTSSRDSVNYTDILKGKVTNPVIENDSRNRVIISQAYANAIITTLNLPSSNSGSSFGAEAIPGIISKLVPGFSEQDIADVMQGKTLTSSYDASLVNTLTGEDTEENTTVDNSEKLTANLRKIINFYQPIFTAASQRGWSC